MEQIEAKETVVKIYETNTFNTLLGESMHPGGLQLTERAFQNISLSNDSAILNLCCGKGSSDFFLSQKYGCKVVGIDLSRKAISTAQDIASKNGANVEFHVADAQNLPFNDENFDIVLSECSFSVLEHKTQTASEIRRVLRPDGTFVMSDLFVKDHECQDCNVSSRSLKSALPLVPCVDGAMTLQGYIALFEHIGFQCLLVEDHTTEMKKLGFKMAMQFGSREQFMRCLSTELGSTKNTGGQYTSIDMYKKIFKEGRLEYGLLKFSKLR